VQQPTSNFREKNLAIDPWQESLVFRVRKKSLEDLAAPDIERELNL
jgi:hypothetical protein